jgi:RHS repeat-associated protein
VTTTVNGVPSVRTLAVTGATNRLSAASYNAAGEQLTSGPFLYDWDQLGLLKSYQGSGNDHAYAYDADDERALSFNVATGESVFRLRGLDGLVLREFRLAGGVWSWHRDYIHRGGQLLAQVGPGADGLRFAHLDHLGTPRLYTDAGGTPRESRKHYPYGEILAATTPGSSDFVMAFTGHERDDNGVGTTDDLDYMHARYYSPLNGRFLSFDPGASARLMMPQSWNKYSYARNSPVRYQDPDGEDARDVINGIGNSLSSNITLGGVPRGDGNADFRLGQRIGDGASVVLGFFEALIGGTAALGGGVAEVASGGTLSLVALPTTAGGVLLAGHGLAVVNQASQSHSQESRAEEGRSGSGRGAKQREKKQLDDIAQEFGLDRRGFGDFVEEEKFGRNLPPDHQFRFDELREIAELFQSLQ